MTTADAIIRTLESPNVCDANGEKANVVDAIASLAYSARKIADAITPVAQPGNDGFGTIASLTEAVMGITSGLCRIADSISELAVAIAEKTP